MFSALKGATVPCESLTERQRAQMLALMQVCYAGVSAERFTRDLSEKQYVILLSARRSGELVGFSTLRVAEEQVEGRSVEVVFSGDTVIHPDYWGQKELQVRFGRFMLARKLTVLGDAEDQLELSLEGYSARPSGGGRVVYSRPDVYYGLEVSQALPVVAPRAAGAPL